MSRNAGSGEIGRFDEIFLTNLAKFVQILGKTGKSGEILPRLLTFWVNVLTCPEASQTVGENGDSDKISPRG